MNTDTSLSPGQTENLRRKLENLKYDCSEGVAKACKRFLADRGQSGNADPWPLLTECGGTTFSEVFQRELDALEGRADAEPGPADLAQVNERAHKTRLAGLAFSGGGIRSATFNLGVLQALAEMRLLRDFDYLSTVSGGGYIGGWLSKWIQEKNGDVGAVEDQLVAAKEAPCPRSEPWPVQFLRRYSNYLTPQKGMFSADTWTLICTYVRNTLLNMLLLFACLGALFLAPRLVLYGVEWGMGAVDDAGAHWVWVAAAMLLALWSVFRIALSISRKGRRPLRGMWAEHQSVVLKWICLPLVGAGLAGSVAVWVYRSSLANYWDALPLPPGNPVHLVWPGAAYFLAWAAGWAVAQGLNQRFHGWREWPAFAKSTAVEGVGHFMAAAVALAVGSLLLLKGVSVMRNAGAAFNSVELVTFGMPLMLGLFGLSVTLMIGLIGRMYGDDSREWWARQGAWTLICALAWLVVFACTFYLPALVEWAWQNWVKTATAGTLLTGLAMLAGLRSGSDKDTGKDTGKRGGARWKEFVAQVAPYAFTLLTIAALTTALQALVAPVAPTPRPRDAGGRGADVPVSVYIGKYACRSVYIPPSDAGECGSAPAAGARTAAAPVHILPRLSAEGATFALFAGLLAVGLLLSWRVDVNKFSLYMMYRLRLVRAYFGATTPVREPHPFTGFDPNDDRPLGSFHARPAQAGATGREVQRPIHLINAAVNIVGGKELAWQTRKAGNFCFSPAYCGFELPHLPDDGLRPRLPRGAFRPTSDYASDAGNFQDHDAGIKLGSAIAVSGAAASPNMGYHSSPPLSFLMTLFNLRLGRWSPNPIREKTWKKASPGFGLGSIFSELLGLTDTTARFLYLSDGGHFENLGIYELVRRRCRLIVVVDASSDQDLVRRSRQCGAQVPDRLQCADRPRCGPHQAPQFREPARRRLCHGLHSLQPGRRRDGPGRGPAVYQANPGGWRERRCVQLQQAAPGVPAPEHGRPVVRRGSVRELPDSWLPFRAQRAAGGRPRSPPACPDRSRFRAGPHKAYRCDLPYAPGPRRPWSEQCDLAAHAASWPAPARHPARQGRLNRRRILSTVRGGTCPCSTCSSRRNLRADRASPLAEVMACPGGAGSLPNGRA